MRPQLVVLSDFPLDPMLDQRFEHYRSLMP